MQESDELRASDAARVAAGSHPVRKCLVAACGGIVLLVGLVLLVLPGPGLPVVAAGVAILATEFLWARRAWRKARGTAAQVRRRSGLRAWLHRSRVAPVDVASCAPLAPDLIPHTTMSTSTEITPTPVPARPWLALGGWVLLCFTASAIGAFFMPGEWYAGLKKPSWNPPSWVFGPVWTTLYASMAVAAWLVWRRGGWTRQSQPLAKFVFQLALNAAWTPLFFGLKNPGIAFAEIVVLWLAIVATIAAFWRVHRGAALLLGPYVAWVTFAAFLNFTLWQLNR